MDSKHLGISSSLLAFLRLGEWDPVLLSTMCLSASSALGKSPNLLSADWHHGPKASLRGLPQAHVLPQKRSDEQLPTPTGSAAWWEAELALQLAGAGEDAASPCLLALLRQAGPARAVGGSRQLPHLGQRRRQQATASQAGAERGHQPGTTLLAWEKQGGSSLPLLCHFCISSFRSMRKLYLGMPLSL